jgi:hypothetical protein
MFAGSAVRVTTADMDEQRNALDERAGTRAHLLPEELDVGSADPEDQAREILRESDQRTEAPEPRERRRPEETT